MDEAIEKSAMRKIYLRLLPFAILSYILAYIDRINVSFAGLTMRGDLKLSATDFGFALGTFFLGYFIFEVPSNVIMEKVGARIWIARIMITWGMFAGPHGVRLRHDELLHRQVPARRGRGRLLPGHAALFHLLVPAQASCPHRLGIPRRPAGRGRPRRADLDGAAQPRRPVRPQGLADHVHRRGDPDRHGRLPDAARADRPSGAGNFPHRPRKRPGSRPSSPPSVRRREDKKFGFGKVLVLSLMYLVITLVSLGLLYYTPQITAWLKASFGDVPPVVVVLIPYIFGTIGLLVWGRIADHNLWKAMINAKVLLLAVNYFGIVTASLGMLYFIPQIIKSLGNFSNMEVGWLTMIPYICGGIGMVVWGRVSDAMNERRWNLLVACVLSTGGLVLAGYTMGTWWALVGMSMAAVGFYGSKGPFFAMPPMFLSGTALAGAGFAWINSIGNLGGTVGPYYVGYMRDLTGNFAGGLYGLALLSLIAALVCAFFLHIPQPGRVEAPQAATPHPA